MRGRGRAKGSSMAEAKAFNAWLNSHDYILGDTMRNDWWAEKKKKDGASDRELMRLRKMPDMKKCRKCGEMLPYTAFNAAPRNKDGLQGICRECSKEEQRTKYARLKADAQKIGLRKRES